MTSGLRVAFLLLLVTGTVTAKGLDLSDAPNDNELNHEAAAQRLKRGWLDSFRHKETTDKPAPAAGDGFGFNLADALHPDPKPSKPAGGNGFGFNLEDALRPAEKPVDGGSYQRILIEKLNEVLENQKLLLKPKAPTSRFYNGR